jgi:serine/threonine-protein phosphatase PPG1
MVVEKFLHENRMDHILRAHQLCMEGFQVLFDDQLSTVWSAPNYCYRCGNLASILEIGVEGERHFNVFEAAPENERPTPAEAQRALFSNGVPAGLFSNGGSNGAGVGGGGPNGSNGAMTFAGGANGSNGGIDATQVPFCFIFFNSFGIYGSNGSLKICLLTAKLFK